MARKSRRRPLPSDPRLAKAVEELSRLHEEFETSIESRPDDPIGCLLVQGPVWLSIPGQLFIPREGVQKQIFGDDLAQEHWFKGIEYRAPRVIKKGEGKSAVAWFNSDGSVAAHTGPKADDVDPGIVRSVILFARPYTTPDGKRAASPGVWSTIQVIERAGEVVMQDAFLSRLPHPMQRALIADVVPAGDPLSEAGRHWFNLLFEAAWHRLTGYREKAEKHVWGDEWYRKLAEWPSIQKGQKRALSGLPQVPGVPSSPQPRPAMRPHEIRIREVGPTSLNDPRILPAVLQENPPFFSTIGDIRAASANLLLALVTQVLRKRTKIARTVPPLPEGPQRVFDLIYRRGPISGVEICAELGIEQSTLTSHFIPQLKRKPYNVRNRPGAGYYVSK